MWGILNIKEVFDSSGSLVTFYGSNFTGSARLHLLHTEDKLELINLGTGVRKTIDASEIFYSDIVQYNSEYFCLDELSYRLGLHVVSCELPEEGSYLFDSYKFINSSYMFIHTGVFIKEFYQSCTFSDNKIIYNDGILPKTIIEVDDIAEVLKLLFQEVN